MMAKASKGAKKKKKQDGLNADMIPIWRIQYAADSMGWIECNLLHKLSIFCNLDYLSWV